MNKPLRFGILGAGNIAGQFAHDAPTAQRSIITAIGSRSLDSAQAFAQTHGIPRAHGSYGALLNDPEVDAVYLTLPNTMHKDWTLRALQAGKHVLCEKPMAMNERDAAEMFDAAEQAGRVLVEAYMYRAHPLTGAVVRAVHGGAIGELRLIRVSFCYRTSKIDGNTRFVPALGGGSLMDIGGYCLSYAQLLAGCAPDVFHVAGRVHPTGVDEYAAGVLRFDGGRIVATFTCGMTAQADNVLHLGGTEGFINVPVPWKPPAEKAVYHLAGQTPPKMGTPGAKRPAGPPATRAFHIDSPSALYAMEADAFADVVQGEREPFMPRQDTLDNLRLLRAMREQLGLSF